MKAFITYWLPVVMWMGAIYWGSSQSVLPEPLSSPSWQGVLLRKTVHLVEYAVLGALLWRALFNTPLAQRKAERSDVKDPRATSVSWRGRSFPVALMIGLLYAIFDEWHQSLIPNREARLLDVVIDMAGIVAALGLIEWCSTRRLEDR